MTPTTQPAMRIATLFRRRLTTPWLDKEIRQYKALVKACYLTDVDLDLIERYYAFERRKGEKGIHRRDLCTFLNNFAGELDRARAWDQSKRKPVRNGQDRPEGPATDSDYVRIGALARAEMERLREKLRIPA